MKQHESFETQIDWEGLESDEQIIEKLKELMQDTHVSSIEMRSKSKEDVTREIKEYIESRGYPYSVHITVSEPNEVGQRMVMGMTYSRLTRKTLSF